MEPDRGGSTGHTFHEDRRGVWRVTWTLAYAFLMVAWLMSTDGALLWPLFGGLSLALAAIGVSAVVGRRRPLLDVRPEGLRLHPGSLGPGDRGAAEGLALPWSAIARVAFEWRTAARRRGPDEHPMRVRVLAFRLRDTSPPPGRDRGLLERVMGRDGEMALGEHFAWNGNEHSVDLRTSPQGGFPKLTAAIARAEPRLGDASEGERRGLGGPLAYAAYDGGVALAVVGTLLLWATGRMHLYTELARSLLAWGDGVLP